MITSTTKDAAPEAWQLSNESRHGERHAQKMHATGSTSYLLVPRAAAAPRRAAAAPRAALAPFQRVPPLGAAAALRAVPPAGAALALPSAVAALWTVAALVKAMARLTAASPFRASVPLRADPPPACRPAAAATEFLTRRAVPVAVLARRGPKALTVLLAMGAAAGSFSVRGA